MYRHDCKVCFMHRRILGLADVIDGLMLMLTPWHVNAALRVTVYMARHQASRQMRERV